MPTEASPRLRIGIDVGGTFTHGVVLNLERDVVASARFPTTHRAKFGVAEGIVDVLKELLAKVDPASIELVAHSTTQATNAILEGDVAPVSLVLILKETQAALARALFRETSIELSESSRIELSLHMIGHDELPPDQVWMNEFRREIKETPVIALVESLGTDDPTGELESLLAGKLGDEGLLDTRSVVRASELSARLGLKLRAKTAVINAAMIPKIVSTARFTRDAVERVLPGRKLVVMKSDGGVMDAGIMEDRPLNCVLSGPAAGASAAIHISKISDGIFLEVGGTSTDISLVLAGRVRKRAATLGGHVLHTRSLDLRTVGVGGGSLLWKDARGSIRCGPRSAHILGLSYLSYPPKHLDMSNIELVSADCHSPHICFEAGGVVFGVTLTDAANYLGIIPESDDAFSDHPLVHSGFESAAGILGKNPEVIARRMIGECRERIIAVIKGLVADYAARLADLRIVGGGGGVHSIAGEVARAIGLPFEVSPHPAVISAVGAAAAVSTFSHEVFCPNPGESDLKKLKSIAVIELEKAGVPSDQIKTTFEFDSRQKLLRIEAEGALGFERMYGYLDDDSMHLRAAELAGVDPGSTVLVLRLDFTAAYVAARIGAGFFRRKTDVLVCLDRFGRSLITLSDAIYVPSNEMEIEDRFAELLSANTRYTDGGETAPEVYIMTQTGLVDLSSFISPEQILGALRAHKDEISGDCLLIVRKRG
ncbi:hypothetical protein J7K50_07435 [bacterium]|nr:hypothetical protein [bacterium]